MKADLAKINKIIARDLGENFDIDDALEEENGWRGRHEIIKNLTEQGERLQRKLIKAGLVKKPPNAEEIKKQNLKRQRELEQLRDTLSHYKFLSQSIKTKIKNQRLRT